MQLSQLIDGLSQPAAYPDSVSRVEVRHTHISVVFLAGSKAYKIKKPVALGFLDFTTLESRRHCCAEEVRLNRRLAPNVYIGVVPVTGSGGQLRFEAPGEVVEWAVKMERLPEEATLRSRLLRGEVGRALIETLARTVAGFHAQAGAGQHISRFGLFEVVAANARENFTQSAPLMGITVSGPVHERLRALTEEALIQLRPLIDVRAERGVPRDTHGDLHLDHVYFFPEKIAPANLIIVDCIEFNERFRFADPVADVAFLVMDLLFYGRRHLASIFAAEYFLASDDVDGRALLPFYTAYRAAVRGKVEGFELGEREIPATERAAALARARAHWLLALAELEAPSRKPCLVLVGGLPGTGKSTLARALAAQARFCLIRTDIVRKEMAARDASIQAATGYQEGIYAPEFTERTYTECLNRAEALLFEGKRVLVDATFREERRRRAFLNLAAAWRVPGMLFLCHANSETVRSRLQHRRNDVSDADWSIYRMLAEMWEEPAPLTEQCLAAISTEGSEQEAVSRAIKVLRAQRLQE